MLFDQVNRELDITMRHLEVLKAVIERGPIGILKLAEETGMPTHKVRYSLRVLEQEQLIKPSSYGAIKGSSVESFIADFEKDVDELIAKAELIKNMSRSF